MQGNVQDQGKKGPHPLLNEIVTRVNDNTKRLRLLEERERLLTGRTNSMDESFYQKIGELDARIKDMEASLANQEEGLTALQNGMKELSRQLKFLATKTDLKRVEEMARLLDPLKAQLMGSEQGK